MLEGLDDQGLSANGHPQSPIIANCKMINEQLAMTKRRTKYKLWNVNFAMLILHFALGG